MISAANCFSSSPNPYSDPSKRIQGFDALRILFITEKAVDVLSALKNIQAKSIRIKVMTV
ncbi:MAG: hypothetical protein VZR00_07480 [Lachnospiraceae bacterium]|nr:hypothetical protein [Lachnospiraceae bacterium]